MTPSFATRSDLPALRRLWMRCFGDSLDYVNLYFDHGFREDAVFVLRDAAGLPVSMAIRFSVDWLAADGAEQHGAYLYAVCTDPAHRGEGCFRTLMDFAERTLALEGCDFVCLKPADTALAETYRRRGYANTFTNRVLTVAAGERAASLEQADAARYYGLRELAMRGSYLCYAPEVLAHQARLGPLFFVSDGTLSGCGAAEWNGRTLLLKEYLGDEALLPAIVRAFGAGQATVRTPGDAACFAMAKPLSGKPCPTGYLGLAFD